MLRKLTPVKLASGRARFATRPCVTGSSATLKMIEIVVVAAFAASTDKRPPGAAIAATRRRTKFGRQRRKLIILVVGPAAFNRDIPALNIPGVLQPLAKSAHWLHIRLGRLELRKSDKWNRRLLRVRREWPRCGRAAEQSDEFAPSHVVPLKPRITPYHITGKAVLCITAFWPT